jgi:hypothetical protein
VTVTPAASQPDLPEGVNSVGGTAYTFGPEGTTFSSPVTVTVKYDPAKAPGWAIPSDFALYHYDGTAWEALPGLVVDGTAHTVSAQTTSFSPFTIGTRLPPATITPSPGSVNINQRSVMFTGADAQYTMTQPSLPPGDLDEVQVIVRGNINPATPNVVVPLARAEAIVNSSLNATFEVNPDQSTPGFGQTQNLDALVRNKDGTIYTAPANLPVLMIWTSSDIHGSLDIANPNHKTSTSHGVYTAKVQSQSAALPPRIDQITVDFYVGYMKSYVTPITQFGQTIQRVDSIVARFDVKNGTTSAFLEVAPKTYLANFKVRTTPSPGGSCVTADAVVPKVSGATSYDLTVTGIVGSALGTTFHKVFTGTTSTGSILDIYDTGSFYGVPMDGGCATTPAAITARQNLYQNQFGSANFTVKTTP